MRAEAERDALESRPPGGDGATASEGVYWTPVHEDSGSRQNGCRLLPERLSSVMKLERPRLFVFNTCRQFIRTASALPRDEVDMDDVDSAAEDRVGEAGMRTPGYERKGSAAAPGVAVLRNSWLLPRGLES